MNFTNAIRRYLLGIILIFSVGTTVRAYYFDFFKNHPKISMTMTVAIVGYLTQSIRHTFDLNIYRDYINKSLSIDNKLTFGSYLWNDQKFVYPAQIKEHTKDVAQCINDDAQARKLPAGEINTLEELRNCLRKNKSDLEQNLRNIARYTDAPQKFIAWYIRTFDQKCMPDINAQQDAWPIEKVFGIIEKLVKEETGTKDYRITTFIDLQGWQQIKNALQLTAWPERLRKELLFTPFYLPWTWMIASRYQKATNLFLDFLFLYARLIAIKQVVDDPEFKLNKIDTEKFEVLKQDAINYVQTLKNTFKAKMIPAEKTSWISVLQRLKETLEKLSLKVESTDRNWQIVRTHLETLEKAVNDQKFVLKVDNAHRYLDTITQHLNLLGKLKSS